MYDAQSLYDSLDVVICLHSTLGSGVAAHRNMIHVTQHQETCCLDPMSLEAIHLICHSCWLHTHTYCCAVVIAAWHCRADLPVCCPQIGFLGPAFFLTQLSKVTTVKGAVLCMMACQGLDACSQSGLYSNHQVTSYAALTALLCGAMCSILACATTLKLTESSSDCLNHQAKHLRIRITPLVSIWTGLYDCHVPLHLA